MRNNLIFLLIALLITIPVVSSARLFARWHTSMGSFTAELYDELVPITANNFRDLANSGFYNDLIFHRVIDGFMIQDGCPYGTGYGGPGYTIQDEFHPDLFHDHAGVLAMARTSAPNSAGSQYYITVAPATHLDGSYAIFGDIIEGLDNVLAIGAVPTDANDRPLTPVDIYTLRMLDLQIGEFFPTLDQLIEIPQNQTQMFVVEAYTEEAELSFEWYIDEELSSESSFLLETSFATGGDHTVRCHIASSDSIAFDAIWEINTGASVDALTTPAVSSASLKVSPNPFKNQLEISCELKESQSISLDVFNLKGQKISEISSGDQSAGTILLNWDGRDAAGIPAPAGVYLLRMQSPQGSIYRKISKL
jgi:cyclophilin family peptidyl-prolyl cis-trans isomerase